MSIGETIAKIRFEYYLTMVDINDALYQLRLINDETCEKRQKRNCLEILKIAPRLPEDYFKGLKK